eukprot:CAMPEP_0114589596 /NCGR_PEP_ID=MMETSP0125-20121206/12012_1 /TAXON_ID=485358 ORGANISM="Aristerostoma sp., Strain ATCC 50986" /NCGR_SAMPLE_ID=MMETSP0125 /ASSEMBLY_ACC=CAM_ASM_000245 /LENGTH=68 /DNA_ID=CAMNT_0001786577 /DNA_START=2335 /DNA_END=2541 /DNA_ORIENTATION=+
MNVEFHILDVLENLSPDLKKFKTYKEAHEACIKLQKIKQEEEEAKEMSELRISKEDSGPEKSEEEEEK